MHILCKLQCVEVNLVADSTSIGRQVKIWSTRPNTNLKLCLLLLPPVQATAQCQFFPQQPAGCWVEQYQEISSYLYVFCFSAIVALEPNQKGFIVWHTASIYMERKYYTLLAIDREIETYIILASHPWITTDLWVFFGTEYF